MNNVCIDFMPGGVGADCLRELAEVKNIFIADKSQSFASVIEAMSTEAWREDIEEDLSVYVPQGVSDYENTTDDPNISTLQSTRKIITNRPAPSIQAYISGNFCDYSELLGTLDGGTYRVYLELVDGTILATKTSAGVVKGMKAQITAITKGPLKGDIQNSFAVYINFTNYNEFVNGILMKPVWSPTDTLLEMVPVGYSMFITTPYTASDVIVQINERCGAFVESLAVADFEVVDSNNLDTPIVSAVVDDGAGAYTLTLEKGTVPASLDAGDYMTIRVKALSTLIVDYLSNRVKVIA